MQLRRVLPTIGRAAVIVIVAACAILVLWQGPKRQVASLRNAKGVEAKDVFKAENDARATLAQILGGFAVLIGLYFAWKNIAATAKNVKLTESGQITDRFYKAIEQLGGTQFELRLGGIYALERIARDSEKDHWPIMEVLTAYVRNNSAHARENEKEADLIQAILTVIRRREWSYEKPGQNLDLHEADLHGANLEGANLTDAHLSGANLSSAVLEDAHLNGAHLEVAHLGVADLEGAHLAYAHGLTQEQVDLAFGDETTNLQGTGVTMPESWKKKASSS